MSETKKCAQCGQEKPIEDFSKSYKNLCKSCVADNVKRKRLEGKDFFSSARGLNVVDSEPRFIPHPRFQAAMAAMQGLLANNMTDNDTFDEIARKSVACADALLNELSKPKDENDK